MLFFHKWPSVQQTTPKMMILHSEQNWKNVKQMKSFADVLQNRCSKNFANFTGKHLCWSLFLKRLQRWGSAALSKRDSTHVFSCQVWEIFMDTFFYRTSVVAASGDNKSHTRLFTLSKQTFSSRHVTFLRAYYLRFYRRWKQRNTNKKFFRVSLCQLKRLKIILRISAA